MLGFFFCFFLQIITGESVVKFYDDVLKEKDHQLDIIQLSNENLRRKYKVSWRHGISINATVCEIVNRI